MANKNVARVDVRMYKMGTGDCFALKFIDEDEDVTFKMIIDSGAQSGSKVRLTPYVKDLLTYVDGSIDVLVITHEHQDHVLAFQRCKELFQKGLTIGEVWFAWTENDADEKVKEWKREYGKKKRALAFAGAELHRRGRRKAAQEEIVNHFGRKALVAQTHFIDALDDFTHLHIDGPLVNGLQGMEVIKKELGLAKTQFKFLTQGQILQDIEGLTGMKIYVLGPPNNWDEVKKEKGKGNEAYKHNKDLEYVRGFSNLYLGDENAKLFNICPFQKKFIQKPEANVRRAYASRENSWRKVDLEWLYSSAKLALRLNRGINNLSLVLAMEFECSRRVLLFPGDAEIGSWQSWHDIAWEGVDQKDEQISFAQELLQRTVFYKVAHHLSHNGTAKEEGLDLMTHRDLVAMATLDYQVISKTWKNTMPNRGILKDLLAKTRGRLIMMNERDLFLDRRKTRKLKDEIKTAQGALTRSEKKSYKNATQSDPQGRWVQYSVVG